MSCLALSQYASGIWDDLGNPSGISISYISGWMINNLGKLNILIGTCFTGDPSTCISPEVTIAELAILGEMFSSSYYAKQVRNSLGAGGFASQWTMVKEGDTTIQRSSVTQIAKEYSVLKQKADENVIYLAQMYKLNNVRPVSIDFPDIYNQHTPPDGENFHRL